MELECVNGRQEKAKVREGESYLTHVGTGLYFDSKCHKKQKQKEKKENAFPYRWLMTSSAKYVLSKIHLLPSVNSQWENHGGR